MKRDQIRCESELLNRFFDQEIGMDEMDRLDRHLKDCPFCQKVLRDNRSIAAFFRTGLEKEISLSDHKEVEERIMALIQSKKDPWRVKIRAFCESRKRLIPVTAMVAVLVLFFSLIRHPVFKSGPSAIISSFSGNISSVMFMETPKSHQTIIWFNEKFISTGEDDSAQKSQNTA